MFIPSSIRSLEDMLSFLEPCVQDGLFDSVAYDDENDPAKIVCTQGGNTLLEISGGWTFKIFNSASVSEIVTNGDMGFGAVTFACRCSGGVFFIGQSYSGYQVSLVIGKTSAGRTGFITARTGAGTSTPSTVTYQPKCWGDDTGLALRSFTVTNNYANADRTILTKIPVAGVRGSTDCFTTVFSKNVAQFSETGTQLIGGKRFGCAYYIAMLDDEEDGDA